MYKKIGIVDDGSKNASVALKTLVRFATHQGVSFTILGVLDILTPMKKYFTMGGEKWGEEIDIFRKGFQHDRARIKKILAEDEKYAKASGISPSIIFLEGQPSEQISAQTKKYDILFVGGYAKTKRKIENIAGRLAREAQCDVFAARKDEIKEILLALKGTALDREIIEKGILFAKCFGAHVTALHVAGSLSGGKANSSIVKKAKEVGLASNIKVRALLARGGVASKILAHAKKSDLVIMGTQGVGGLGDMVIGTLAERITKKATCSVLVVRREKKKR
jgi:nucleotide-binding universal stress UspA family protein